MSRIGRKPIHIPSGITVKVDDKTVSVSNGKQTLCADIPSEAIHVNISENVIEVTRDNDNKETRALHGLVRSLVANQQRDRKSVV